MSQSIYLGTDETGLWVCGGNVYRSRAQAERHGPAISYETDEDGKYIRDRVRGRGRNGLIVKELYPIHYVGLDWNAEEPDASI